MRYRERRIVTAAWVAAVAIFVAVVCYLYLLGDGVTDRGQFVAPRLKHEPADAYLDKLQIDGDHGRSIDAGNKSKDTSRVDVLKSEHAYIGKNDAGDDREGKQKKKNDAPAPETTAMGCMDLGNIDRGKALKIGHRRIERGFLTIGITNVKRKNASYLKPTLQSLIDNASEGERSNLRIVVFACDFDERDRQEARDIVLGSFAEHVQSGLLLLIEAPRSFYPPLENLKRTFNDPEVRVRWRSKENIDNVFLFAYSVNMSDYYMLLDDDLYTFPGYFKTIRNFVAHHQNDHWSHLDISERGTGKLFRNGDLLRLARFLVLFCQEQPVDLLLNAMMQLRSQTKHFVVVPPLFKHLGKVSTLELKNKNNG